MQITAISGSPIFTDKNLENFDITVIIPTVFQSITGNYSIILL